jgi:hypothetical protein
VVEPGRAEERREDDEKSLFDTLRIGILTGLPALSAFVFIVVAVKVFRASLMETTTTVAIVSNADAVALLKGVILTLLPGFLAGLTAASIWWWGGVLPSRSDTAASKEAIGRALFCPQSFCAWAFTVMAFFTIWWPVFLLLCVPVLATTAALSAHYLGLRTPPSGLRVLLVLLGGGIVGTAIGLQDRFNLSWAGLVVIPVLVVAVLIPIVLSSQRFAAVVPVRRALRAFGLVGAAVFIGILTLEPSVWLPLREITVQGKQRLILKDKPLEKTFAAYVLSRDKDSVSLFLERPRAVIQVRPRRLWKAMPLCVPPPSKWRIVTLRASQILHADPDRGTPYPVCPDLRRKRF